MLSRRTTLLLVFVALATLSGLALSRLDDSALVRAELNAQDFLVRHGRRAPANPKLIFLAIDSDSISLNDKADLEGLFGIKDGGTPEGQALSLMSRHWPWPRSVYALVLDRLMAAGVRTVAFDLIFPTPSEDDRDDDLLRAALDRYADRVVIGSNFSAAAANQSGRINASLTLPSPSLIPQTETPDARVGFVNFWPDVDGVIRRARFQTSFAQFIGAQEAAGGATYTSLAAHAARKSRLAALESLDSSSRPFRFTGPPQQGFPPHSIFEIFVPEYWKRNFQAGAVFQDAIVVVGAAGNWQHDEHPTPFGVMSGPEIQLNVVNALLHREFLRPMSGPAALAVWVLVGAAGACCGILCTRPLLRIALLLGTAAGAALQFPLFNHLGLVGPIVGPLAVLAFTGLFTLIYDLICAAAEEIRLQLALIERRRAEEILKTANEELERRVAERTVELTHANEELTGHVHEKDVLLKEIHHRVKNNLQVISSLLNLQAGYIEDPAAREIFVESRNRVRSMALIHEKLYQSHDLSRIDFQDYLRSLTKGLNSTFAGRSGGARVEIDVDSILLGVDAAVPCGLIVNELVTNCYKHAFRGIERGEIKVSMKRLEDDQLCLSVSDNGVGIPKDLDIQNTESLGLQLVTTLAEQINGSVSVRNGCGSTFDILFSEPKPKT